MIRAGAVEAPLARTRVAPPRAPDVARSKVFLNTVKVLLPFPLTQGREPNDAKKIKSTPTRDDPIAAIRASPCPYSLTLALQFCVMNFHVL